MLVSICIGTYNNELSIRKTLDSIIKQTYTDFEVIIVDDHSTDNTAKIILEEYCLKDNRFKLFVNITADKYIDSHNLSYEYANGEYLFRIDADDILYEDYLKFHVEFLNTHPNIDAFSTKMKRCKAVNGEIIELTYEEDKDFADAHSKEELDWFNKNNAYSYCGNTVIWSNPSSSIRKSFYDKYHPKYISYGLGDYIFWWNVLACGGRLYKSNVEKSIHCDYKTNASSTSDFYFVPYNIMAKLSEFKETRFALQKDYEQVKKYKEEKIKYKNLCD